MTSSCTNDGAIPSRVILYEQNTLERRHHGQSSSPLYIRILLVVILILLTPCHCQIKVLSPPSLVALVKAASDSLDSDVMLGTTATFGAPSYGESFVGQVVLAPNATRYCDPDYTPQMGTVEKDTIDANGKDGLKTIFLIPRGGCSFVTKVSIAEQLKADAVIFTDSDNSLWTRKELSSILIADDGYGGSLRIPSVMVTKEDGRLLRGAVTASSHVVLQLQWTLPQKSIVTMEFWSDSGSTAAQRFLKDYAYHANALRGHLLFTPHYSVYGLKADSPDGVNLLLCLDGNVEICTNPPDKLHTVITGSDVLQEDARQLCLWNLMVKEVDGIRDSKFSAEWWEYVRKFQDSCPLVPSKSGDPKFGATCSLQIMASIPGIDVDAVNACYAEKRTTYLLEEKSNKAWSSLALRINGARFNGALDPLQVSRAVCSAFETAPEACTMLTGQEPLASAMPGISLRTILLSVIGFCALLGLGLYSYQHFMKKSMRTALRHEVMMEVRSQLQEYHELEDSHSEMRAKQKRPLMRSQLQ